MPSTTVSFRAHSGRARSGGAHQLMSSRPRQPPANQSDSVATSSPTLSRAEPADGRRDRLRSRRSGSARCRPGDSPSPSGSGAASCVKYGWSAKPPARRARVSRWAIRSRIGRPIVPASISARRARYQGRNRQFSWIIRRTPAGSQASIIATRSGRGRRRRLLAEDVDPVPRRQLDELAVRLGPGADLDEVERLLALEQGSGVGVEPGPRDLFPCLLEPLPVQIAERRSLACETLAQPST